MAANHEVDVDLVKRSDGPHANRRNLPPFMHQGETVHYTSTDGAVRIDCFKSGLLRSPRPFPSPFLDSNGNVVLSITQLMRRLSARNMGIYICHCFVTRLEGKKLVGRQVPQIPAAIT